MAEFIRFEVSAVKANGETAKFLLHSQDGTARPFRGTTHDQAFQAETDLYNRLVRVFQGPEER